MREIEIGDIAWQIADRCSSEEEVQAILARLATVDYRTLMSKIEHEHNQWKCGLCREFKDRRTFTFVYATWRVPPVCPECFAEKAVFQATCIGCQQGTPALVDMAYTCPSCEPMKISVSNNNTRARKAHLPATLTLRQWVQAMRYFEGKCAYCNGPYQCLEHYVPLSLGGGSTADNCLPCCYRCNLRKKNLHPDDFAALFPAFNLERIRAYLDDNAVDKLAFLARAEEEE